MVSTINVPKTSKSKRREIRIDFFHTVEYSIDRFSKQERFMPKRSPEMPLTLARSAFTLFSREGIRQVNLEKVAKAAGVTKGSLYWHFGSKQDLIEAAAAYYYQTYHRWLHSETARCQDPVARLKKAIQLSADLCLFDRGNRVFTLEILSLSLYDETLRRGWLQFYDSVRAMYIGLLEAACFAGQLHLVSPEQTANRLLEAFEGLKLRSLFEPHVCATVEREKIVFHLLNLAGLGDSIQPKLKRRRNVPAGMDKKIVTAQPLFDGLPR
jgi:TetR/AcrR family transcriptional regulator, mexJK operon transcriptional repressor